MNARKLVGIIALSLVGCGEPPSVTGAWQNTIYESMIMELKEDGTFSNLGDCGAYAIEDNETLRFDGDRYKGSVSYRFEDDELITERVVMPGLPPEVHRWTKIHMPPNFETEEVAGETVPKGIPSLVMFTHATLAVPWQADAVPFSVDAKKGLYDKCTPMEVEIRFFSPNSGQGLIVSVWQYRITENSYRARSGDNPTPLPIGFIDAPDVIRIGRELGHKGPFREIMLGHWQRAGFVWSTRSGYSLDAMTGQQTKGDYTGYVEGYNQDWARATKLLVEAFGNNLDQDGCPILVRNEKEAVSAMICANRRENERKKSECAWHTECTVVGDTVHWKDGRVH